MSVRIHTHALLPSHITHSPLALQVSLSHAVSHKPLPGTHWVIFGEDRTNLCARQELSSKTGCPLEAQQYENIFGCNTSITHLAKGATLWGREMTQITTKRLGKFWFIFTLMQLLPQPGFVFQLHSNSPALTAEPSLCCPCNARE